MENQANNNSSAQPLSSTSQNSDTPSETSSNPTAFDRTKLCFDYCSGTCPFLSTECRHAHGVKYLIFTKEDLAQIPKPEREPHPTKASKKGKNDNDAKEENENKAEDDEDAEPRRNREAGSISFHWIYKFQEECFAKGIVKEFYTLEQLNSDFGCLREIRKLYRATIARDFFTLLCETYQTTYLPRYIVAYFYKRAGWDARWAYLTRNYFATERKVKNQEYVIKLPMGKDFDTYIQNTIIQIVKERKLMESLPVNPTSIRISFFKDIMTKDPFCPELTFFLKIRNYNRLDDYLKDLEKDEAFMEKLCQECGYDYQVIRTQVVFDEESPAYLEFKKKLEELLNEMIKKSSFGFVLYSECKTRVFKTFHKQIHEFSKTDTQVERLIYHFAFKNKILIVNLLSDTYMFSIKKIQDAKLVNLHKEVPKALYQSCFESHETFDSGHSHFSFHHEIDPNAEHVYDKIDEEILNKELDLSKVVLVDSFESLSVAKEIFQCVTEVGIDLEGSLNKNGTIELLQCGCSNNKIVIFDLFGINSKAVASAKAGKTDSNEIALSKEVNAFIKAFMEDPKICKVFHDCRRDSVALHLFTNSCPTNIIDVSALYMLIDQLGKYRPFSKVLRLSKSKSNPPEESKEENPQTQGELSDDKSIVAVMEEIGKYWPPGLNDVFVKYQASHGPNGLKSIFKQRFDNIRKEYFFKRPVDKEFLIYSARDVEDLVEVKNKMIKTLLEVLLALGSNVDEEKTNYVALAASKTYCIFGCDHRKD